MRIYRLAVFALAGFMAFGPAAGATDKLTEFKSGIQPPQNGDQAHHDLCDSNSPSVQDNQLLMRELGLKRFPSPAYNRLAKGMIADTIEDGIIVAMEKDYRKHIEAKKGFHSRYLRSFAETDPAGADGTSTRDRFFQSTFSHPKPLYVSHIYDYQGRNACAWHSIYGESRMCAGRKRTSKPTFSAGIEALEGIFESRVKPALTSGRYTHVMYMAMGWHNDQQVSICRYNAISEAIATASKTTNRPFKPYIIGVTWPSAWFSSNPIDLIDKIGHIGSVLNKADDADEVGYLVGNMIANRLVPLANPKKLPFVALGHSFGTRVINRSVYSRNLLRGGPVGSGPELTIALQPAHSVYRFIPGRGVEGHPFAHPDGLETVLVATSSRRDTANPFAIWSRYVGGRTGLATARKDQNREWMDYTGRDETLGPHRAVSYALDHLDAVSGKPMIVDATGFVFEHNDVMSDDMGRFVAGLINSYAPARK